MDVEAKHIAPDKDGVRIASLDEMSYRQKLWNLNRSQISGESGKRICENLESHGLFTMGDIARCSLGR